jgi:multidrug efflux pump subunit AcrB
MSKDPIERHPIIAWFAGNPVVANLLMVIILGWGIYNAFTLRREAFPSFDAGAVVITVPFNGGVPEDVERGVTIKIEEALQGVDGIDHIRSTSSDIGASVVVEAFESYPMARLLDEIKSNVDAISTFPVEAENPIITENESRVDVLWIDVHGEVPERVLKETARSVKDELLKLAAIDQVDTVGTREYEISIELSEERLRRYDLTFNEVAAAVRANSVDLSGGLLASDRGDISLRYKSQAYTAKEFHDLPLRTTSDGIRLTLRDVAEIRDAFVDQKVLSRFDDKPTVTLVVTTDGKSDIVDAAAQATALVRSYADRFTLPVGVSLTSWNDGSEPIRSRLSLLLKNGLQGGLLVLISLSLFLNLRLALWVAVGIPVSIAGALILFDASGLSLSINMITAFAFIVVLGLIVDDAIVIGESVFTEKEGVSGREDLNATVRGVSRVLTPAVFGVLTTIAAFYPLTQISGRLGNVLGQIATSVIFCLIFSIIESKFILPAHLAHVQTQRRHPNGITRAWAKVQGVFASGLRRMIQKVYRPMLDKALTFRYVTLASFVAVFIVVVSLLPAGKLRFVFFPDIFEDNITVWLELEQGLPVEHLHENTLRMVEELRALDQEIEEEMGANAVRHVELAAQTNTKSSITVNLTSSEERSLSTGDIVNRWRDRIGPVEGARALSFFGTLGPAGQGLSVQLESKSLEDLRAAAEDLKGAVVGFPGAYDVQDSFESGRPEIQVSLTPTGEASGFSRLDLANEVRAAFYGIEAQRIQRGRDEVKAMVRYPERDRSKLETLRAMRVRSVDGNAVPFSIVADTSFGDALATIERADYNRIVTVTANVDKTVSSGDEILARLEKDHFPTMRAQYPGLEISLRGEAEQQQRSLASLKKGLIVSLLLIYILLAIPLRSYLKPLLIMSVIPFGIVGALLGHFVIGIPVSILSLFGLLALSGIVVNDSLVLVHRIDELKKSCGSLKKAVLKAGPQRFRAILLTTLTTFLGLAPILAESSVQAQFLKPMAVSVGFGVIFATGITLLLLPALLIVIDETVVSSFRFYSQLLSGKRDD